MTNTLTTVDDVIAALTEELVRIGAQDEDGQGLEVCFTPDFTVLEVCDNQESSKISLDVAIAWYERLSSLKVPSDIEADLDGDLNGLNTAWGQLTRIKGWKDLATDNPECQTLLGPAHVGSNED